jgi:large subunit ribosomal protein L25
MKTVSLSGSLRENVGKKDAAALRAQGKTPVVIYGGKEQIHFAADSLAVERLVFTPDVSIIEAEIEGKGTFSGIIREIQTHPVTDKVLHIDLLELVDDKEVTMALQVKLNGSALGVRNGGRASFPNKTLKVKGLPKEFPDAIEVEITNVRIGEKIRVGDLSIPGLNILASDDVVLFAVKTARGAMEDEEEEGEEGEEGETAEGAEGASEGEAPAEG